MEEINLIKASTLRIFASTYEEMVVTNESNTDMWMTMLIVERR